MRVQLLPSTIDEDGRASLRQHMLTIIIDDAVAIDAGCLAFACTSAQRNQIRDVVLTHTHLDHIAGLPLYVDDLFASLREPVRVHATADMIETLERDIFNWAIYPNFSTLTNSFGRVLEYCPFERGASINVRHLSLRSVEVNHKVSAQGYLVSDGSVSVAITGDTAQTSDIWELCNNRSDLAAVLVECAFPDELGELAEVSHHLTPSRLKAELKKIENSRVPVYVISLKPMYRQVVVDQISDILGDRVNILEVGRVYDF
jgi:cAMP phosphodiesterase